MWTKLRATDPTGEVSELWVRDLNRVICVRRMPTGGCLLVFEGGGEVRVLDNPEDIFPELAKKAGQLRTRLTPET